MFVAVRARSNRLTKERTCVCSLVVVEITLFSASSLFSLYVHLIYLLFLFSLDIVVVAVAVAVVVVVVAVCLQSKYSLIIFD